MGVLHGGGEVHHRKQEKHKCLHQGHEDAESHDGQGRKKGSGQTKEYSQHQFMPHHVAKEPERQGQHPGHVTDELDR